MPLDRRADQAVAKLIEELIKDTNKPALCITRILSKQGGTWIGDALQPEGLRMYPFRERPLDALEHGAACVEGGFIQSPIGVHVPKEDSIT